MSLSQDLFNQVLNPIEGLKIDLQRTIGLDLIEGKIRALAAINVLHDTTLAFIAYQQNPATTYEPRQYLQVYGFLQALAVHQDALMALGKMFSVIIDLKRDHRTIELREARNLVCHPTNTNIGEDVCFCFIEKTSFGKDGFQFSMQTEDGTRYTQRLNFLIMIRQQADFTYEKIGQLREALERLIQSGDRLGKG